MWKSQTEDENGLPKRQGEMVGGRRGGFPKVSGAEGWQGLVYMRGHVGTCSEKVGRASNGAPIGNCRLDPEPSPLCSGGLDPHRDIQ